MSFRCGLGHIDEQTFRYNNRATTKNPRTEWSPLKFGVEHGARAGAA